MKQKTLKTSLLVICALLLVGCGNEKTPSDTDKKPPKATLSCVKEETDDNGYIVKEELLIKATDGIIDTVFTKTLRETDSKVLEVLFELNKTYEKAYEEVEGFDMTAEKVDDNKLLTEMLINYNTVDVEKLKAVLVEHFNVEVDDFEFPTRYVLDDYKRTMLTNHTCEEK